MYEGAQRTLLTMHFCLTLRRLLFDAQMYLANRVVAHVPCHTFRNAYCADGLGGLQPKQAKGQPGKIPPALADEVRRWVIDGPAKQGLDRANWTHEELADHLLKTKGIKTSRSAVQRFCAKIDIRLYRPTYRHLRGDPEKQARAKEDLADLGKGRRPVSLSS